VRSAHTCTQTRANTFTSQPQIKRNQAYQERAKPVFQFYRKGAKLMVSPALPSLPSLPPLPYSLPHSPTYNYIVGLETCKRAASLNPVCTLNSES